jgi:hypothetical protein
MGSGHDYQDIAYSLDNGSRIDAIIIDFPKAFDLVSPDHLLMKIVNDTNWETLTERRKLARLYALFKACTGEQAWKAVGDRLKTPCYLSRGVHGKKIRSRKQRTDIGKYSSVNRTIQLWNQLPEDALGTLSCKPSSFRKRFRGVINKST